MLRWKCKFQIPMSAKQTDVCFIEVAQVNFRQAYNEASVYFWVDFDKTDLIKQDVVRIDADYQLDIPECYEQLKLIFSPSDDA